MQGFLAPCVWDNGALQLPNLKETPMGVFFVAAIVCERIHNMGSDCEFFHKVKIWGREGSAALGRDGAVPIKPRSYANYLVILGSSKEPRSGEKSREQVIIFFYYIYISPLIVAHIAAKVH